MSDENEPRVVFRTSQHGEAEALAALLNDSGIPTELRIAVPAAREAEAIASIETYMHSIGAASQEARPEANEEAEALLPCPNCETVGISLRKPCAGCGYAVLLAAEPPAWVKGHAPGARTFCPECRDPLTFASGSCASCGEELEPLESGDRLCPPLTHVLYRDTVGGFVCKICRRVWVDVAA